METDGAPLLTREAWHDTASGRQHQSSPDWSRRINSELTERPPRQVLLKMQASADFGQVAAGLAQKAIAAVVLSGNSDRQQWNTGFNCQAGAALSRPSLRHCDLRYCHMFVGSFARFHLASSLTTLRFANCEFDCIAMEELLQALPRLQNLRDLAFRKVPLPGAAVLRAAAPLNLRRLALEYCNLTGGDLAALSRALPRLRLGELTVADPDASRLSLLVPAAHWSNLMSLTILCPTRGIVEYIDYANALCPERAEYLQRQRALALIAAGGRRRPRLPPELFEMVFLEFVQ